MSTLKDFVGNKKKSKKKKPKLNRTAKFSYEADLFFNSLRKDRIIEKEMSK